MNIINKFTFLSESKGKGFKMDFSYQERNQLTDIIENTSNSLFNAIKYIYVIGESSFYNVNVKDIFKVALSDITNPDILTNLNIPLDNSQLGEMSTIEFKKILSAIHYAFVIRLPFLRRMMENCSLKDHHFRELYSLAVKRGAANHGEIVEGTLNSMLKTVKSKQPEPPFDSEWFRRWVYTSGHELAAISNRNMFLFGCLDALFPLYYSALMEKLSTTLLKWQGYSK